MNEPLIAGYDKKIDTITAADLPLRVVQSLEDARITTFWALSKQNYNGLFAIRGIGPKAIRDIEHALAKRNLMLANPPVRSFYGQITEEARVVSGMNLLAFPMINIGRNHPHVSFCPYLTPQKGIGARDFMNIYESRATLSRHAKNGDGSYDGATVPLVSVPMLSSRYPEGIQAVKSAEIHISPQTASLDVRVKWHPENAPWIDAPEGVTMELALIPHEGRRVIPQEEGV